MTEKKNNFAFVTYDGTDENGNRAEVFVQSNKGTIKEIKANEAKQVADVHFAVDKLKFPIHGWVRMDDPIYEQVKEIQASNKEVTFRIETQRKPNVDRSIPMSELRETASKAMETVKVLLVGVDDKYSDEMVTFIKEDPSFTGGRYVAGESDMTSGSTDKNSSVPTIDAESGIGTLRKLAATPSVRSSILEGIASQLLLQGADIDEINNALAGPDKRDNEKPEPRSNFAMEAPAWKEYNSDGRLNLGSSIVTAGVGIETLINDRVQSRIEEEKVEVLTNRDELVDYYLNITFAICDRIQIACYGEGFRPDRGAGSHVRIRGIVYELIKKEHPIPFNINFEGKAKAYIDDSEYNQWVKTVGTEGIKRFARAIEASTRSAGFKYPRPASLNANGGQPTTVTVTTGSVPTQSNVEPVQEATTAPVSAPDPEPVPEPIQEAQVVTEAPTVAETPELDPANTEKEPVVVSTEVDTSLFYQNLITPDLVEGEELATSETLDRFKTTLSELGLNIADKAEQARIAKLLAYSFGSGYSNARKIPDFMLEEFIDHYESAGAETLDQAIREAVK